MNYVTIVPSSCVDFTGWSVVLQLSGCDHMCDGCFNKTFWSSSKGEPFTEDTYKRLLQYAKKPYINNIVIQGGDGLFHSNVGDCITLLRKLRVDVPELNLVLFTGYTFTEVQNDLLRSPILDHIDYLVDGRFEKDRPTKKLFRGSDNQVIHKIVDRVSVEQF